MSTNHDLQPDELRALFRSAVEELPDVDPHQLRPDLSVDPRRRRWARVVRARAALRHHLAVVGPRRLAMGAGVLTVVFVAILIMSQSSPVSYPNNIGNRPSIELAPPSAWYSEVESFSNRSSLVPQTYPLPSSELRSSVPRTVPFATAGPSLDRSESSSVPPSPQLNPSAPADAFDDRMVVLINDFRVANNVAVLTPTRGLREHSLNWSTHMYESGGELRHNPDAWEQVMAYGASVRTFWGENVAWASSTEVSADAVFDAYIKSEGHRANILNPGFGYIGTGSVSVEGAGLWNTLTLVDRIDPQV